MARKAKGADDRLEQALESSASRIAAIIAAAAYEVSMEVAGWSQELRERIETGGAAEASR